MAENTGRLTPLAHQPEKSKIGKEHEKMEFSQAYQNEHAKLTKLFEMVEPEKRELVEGLVDQAAFLFAENARLSAIIREHGSLVINPVRPSIQRTTDAAKQYLKNANAYTVVIKALGSVLQKNLLEGDDPFDQFLREQKEKLAAD